MTSTPTTPEELTRLSKRSAMGFVVLLGVVSLLADATYEGGRSLVGQFLQFLGSSAAAVGIAVGAGEFLGYGLRLVSGYAADRTGAYWRITVIGYTINLLAMPALALVGSWEWAVVLLFVERIGKAIRNPSRDAMLSYATSQMGRGWGYGLHEAMDQIGAFLGPLLVALVLLLQDPGEVGLDGYHQAFLVLIVPAVAAMIVLFVARFLFPRPRDLESKTPKVGTTGLTRRYWALVLASGLVAAGYADFALMAFHFRATELVADRVIPLVFAMGMAVDAAAALVLGRRYDRHGRSTLVGVVAVGSLFAPLAFGSSVPLMLVGVGIWGVGLAAQESIFKAAIADVVPIHRRAYGFGMFATVFGVFWFAGSATMGLLYDVSVGLLVAFSVAIQIGAVAAFVIATRPDRPDGSLSE